jgi:hypothetical protein
MADCFDWVPAEDHGVQEGALYELRYSPRGIVTWRDVETAPFEFVLISRPEVTLLDVRNTGLFAFGDPVARVLPNSSGPAHQVLPTTLQVPAVGMGDVVLDLEELRLCPAPEIDPIEVEAEQDERRREIEDMDRPSNPFAGFLDRFQDVSQGAALIAGLVLLAILWPLLRDLWRGIVRGGTLLWD